MANHKNPSLTTDIFIHDNNSNFILIKRKNDPFKDCWALPGGFVEYGECVETAAIREAKEETRYTAHGDLNSRRADSDAKDIGIFSKDELNEIKIAFDHEKIINDCLSNVEKSV